MANTTSNVSSWFRSDRGLWRPGAVQAVIVAVVGYGCGAHSTRIGEEEDRGVDPDASGLEETQEMDQRSDGSDREDTEREGEESLVDFAPEPGPTQVLGLPLLDDGVLYAGASVVDITPDLQAGRPVYMAGYGSNRVAKDIHDPLSARAVVLSRNREYVAIVALDLVGLTAHRAQLAAKVLDQEGFDPQRLLIHAIHNHTGPDTLGMWGPSPAETGLDLSYQERLVTAIADAVRSACGDARPVTLRADSMRVSSVSPYFTSREFGGKSPASRIVGLIRDTRDPVVVDDTLTAIGLLGPDARAVATIAHVHTHDEASGGHSSISADFARKVRDVLESRFGGVGILWVGAVGGLQTPLDVPIPLTDPEGRIVFATCDESATQDPEDAACYGREILSPRLDAEGDPIPVWAEGRWERTDSYGRLLGRLAADLLETAAEDRHPVLSIASQELFLPLENRLFEARGTHVDTAFLDPLEPLVHSAFPEYEDEFQELKDTFEAAVLDFPAEGYLVTGAQCPYPVTGCLPERVWSVRIGPVRIATTPGELFPEYLVGNPAGGEVEFQDPHARGPDAKYFPQADPDCADVSYDDCRDTVKIGECDCRFAHAAPYRLSQEDPPLAPLQLASDGDLLLLLGLTGDELGYLVPEPDATRLFVHDFEELFSFPRLFDVIEFASNTGDHYEEAVSLGPSAGTLILKALFERIAHDRHEFREGAEP